MCYHICSSPGTQTQKFKSRSLRIGLILNIIPQEWKLHCDTYLCPLVLARVAGSISMSTGFYKHNAYPHVNL